EREMHEPNIVARLKNRLPSRVDEGRRIALAAALLLAAGGVLAGTVHTTTAAGGKWSEIAWTPSAPVSGTGARIVLAGAGSFENDLGTFSLNALTFSATASLAGDGLVFAAEGGANPTLASTGAVTNDVNVAMRLDAPLTWTGNATAGSLRLNGPLSGTGDLIHDPMATNIVDHINGDNSAWSGNLDHRLAYLVVSNSANLGTGGFYCTNATFRATGLVSLRIYGSNTITNRLYLGPESTAQGRLTLQGGNFVVTSPISVNTSKIYGQSATVAIRGPISGNKVVFDIDSASTVSIETPLSLTTGAKQLCLGNTGGKVVLNTPGCDFGYYLGYNRPTLVCGGECYYPTGADFASFNNGSADARLDLNGYSQILGAFTAQGALARPFTILNSKAGTCPTVTIRQTADNATTNLHFSGSMNLVKEGSSLLGIGEPVNGDITVREGVLQVAASIGGDIARKVVVDGGVLDLGGQRVTCRLVEIKGGGSVINGTIAADRVIADEPSYMNSVSFASDVPHASYAHPSGTVIHFPFDGSLAAALRDATANEYDLSVKSGRPVYSAEGRSGGCLYFDGSTVLEVAPFPELVPTGNAPYTVSFWAKAAEGCNTHGGWIGYGKPSVNGGANNFRLNGNYAKIWNYWYARDVGATLPGGNFTDGWHHVVGTYDGTTRRLYCDGVLQTSDTAYTPNFGNEQFLIGKTLNDVNFTGWIDDLLIASRAFTDAEVATLYQNGGVASTQSGSGSILDVSGGDLHFNSAAVYYPFNSAATLLSDHSGNGANLHVAGGSGGTFSADSPFATGGSLYLDGSTWLEASAFPPSMPTGNMARTVACFIKPAADVVKEGAMLSWGTNKSTQYMNFALRSWGDRLGLFPWGSDNVYVSCTRSDILAHWNSLVAVWNGSQLSLYTNGVCAAGPASYQNTSMLATTAGGFTVGKAYYATSYYKGNMAELAVWDRVLTAAEIAAYHQSGAARISPEMEVAHLAGAGSVKASSLTVTDSIDASLALTGSLTLADGVVVAARDAPTVVSGSLTIAGNGTVALPAFDAPFASWTLFTASSISGSENLAGWRFSNLPQNKKATLHVQGGAVVATVANAGMTLILR
ncbi:MAG: LamG domain-containing protein, partial [Kiritimatiellae bacterium]|nr:LamG domain-containing protein [Kiritimatiellia bacterium]